jgi:hypothetical protein
MEARRMVGDDAAGILHGSVADSQRSRRGGRGIKVGSVRKIAGRRQNVRSWVRPSSYIARHLASTTRLSASPPVNLPTTAGALHQRLSDVMPSASHDPVCWKRCPRSGRADHQCRELRPHFRRPDQAHRPAARTGDPSLRASGLSRKRGHRRCDEIGTPLTLSPRPILVADIPESTETEVGFFSNPFFIKENKMNCDAALGTSGTRKRSVRSVALELSIKSLSTLILSIYADRL